MGASTVARLTTTFDALKIFPPLENLERQVGRSARGRVLGRLGAAAREGADEVTATCADIASALGDR